ncbi:hypothetical protein AB835_09440 [Candidatus Endobugula sertula]|uniref:Core-binding (CB) domain-containing protein n=1 Tax=Candidatus Endobugula sertula TaxID=62101 RepID=A0A1D2QP54_9GAMM|nr:hypothetical protein AB835_09440 [Candidatus Endobugula sertula]
MMILSVFPELSLSEARIKHAEARNLLDEDTDPADVKRARKIARNLSTVDTFKALAIEWYEKEKKHWSTTHSDRVNRLLNKDLFCLIGELPVVDIRSPEVLAYLRRIEKRGAIETAHRAKQVAGQVFRYAIATGKAENDPTIALKDALMTPKKSHFAAITDPKEVGSP